MRILKWNINSTVASLFLLTAVTLACLVPFLDKAVNIDDPLFIWSARHIHSHPFDFYGFDLNWYGQEESMAAVTKNPPLCAYYVALVGWLLGWSEVALHAGFLLPALAVVLGTYWLARHFSSHPLWAALVVATAPVFVLSGTSIMSDTLMLAFWVWALFFWIEGLSAGNRAKLCLAALLIGLASLTKYFGLALIPLLMVYSLFERRRIGWWLVFLLLSLLPFAFYQWLTHCLYGHCLLADAAVYATHFRVGGELPLKFLAGFAFVGGCIVILLAAAPHLWEGKRLLAGLFAAVLVGWLIVAWKKIGVFPVVEADNVKWLFIIQMSLLVVAGASLIILAGTDVVKRKTPASILLLLWIGGIFLFTCAVNWTVSGRNILPMLPAVSLLITRRLETRNYFAVGNSLFRLLAPLAISLAIALLVARADYEVANSSRVAASLLTRKLATMASAVKFEGHWGFQYYMEKCGAIPLDRLDPQLSPSEAVIVPVGNSYLFPLPADRVDPGLDMNRTLQNGWPP